MTTQSVQVKIELGHKATVRKKKTADGFTHDWTVFVRGPEGSNVQHFVEKVVMHLHDSFPRPKRVLKEPPYQVSESGYAGFNLPVEIYFKNKEEPRKILFKYDLFLHNEGCPPVNHIRCEKLTFQNPTEEFRRKLIKAGGIGVPGPNDHAQYKPTSASATAITQPAVPQAPPPPAEGKGLFTDLFGAPLYKQDARKKSKSKDKSSKGKNGASPADTPSPSAPSASSSQGKPASNQGKDKSSSNRSSASVSSASSYKSKTSGAGVIPSKEKATLKRPAESSPSSSDGAKKRRSKDDESVKEHSKEKKHKSSRTHRKSHSSSSKTDKKRSSETNGESGSSKSSLSKPSHSQQSSGDSSKSKKTVIDLSDGEISSSSDDDDEDDDVIVTEVEASPASSGNNKNSLSNGGGPLGKLWDEIEQDEEMLSPLPKSSPSNFFSHQSPTLPNILTMSPEKPKSRSNGTSDLRPNKVSPSDVTNQAAPNGETFAMLLELQRRLLSVTDKELLHNIVRIIQDTELYQISDSTFDFDLCSLDSKTVGKLQNFLNLQA